MRLFWLNPLALAGLAAVAIPVAIHLLTNQKTRQVAFPTLRFLRTTRLASLKRRALEERVLLTLRVLIVAAAAGALAAPVFVSASRRAEWGRRVVRAIVVAPGGPGGQIGELVTSEQASSFRSEVFRPEERVANGMRDAATWLTQQPPAVREVVIVGDLKRDALNAADVLLLPGSVGVRFLPTPVEPAASAADSHFVQENVGWRARAELSDRETRVTYAREEAQPSAISVRAAAAEQAAAEEALGAAVARGVHAAPGGRHVVVAFAGGNLRDLQYGTPSEPWMRRALAMLEGMRGGAAGSTLVVLTPARATARDAADIIDRVARAAFIDPHAEPSAMPAATLARWSRPGSLDETAPGDEGDRRWFWGLVLVGLGVETWLRRSRAVPQALEQEESARVA